MINPSQFSNIKTIIVKLTSRCNIQCSYCYEQTTHGKGPHVYMRSETFKTMADFLLANSSQPKLEFIFHGGEPTLLPVSWFDESLNYLSECAKKFQKRIVVSMQTNFIKMSNEMLNCIKRHKIHLGISLDNPAFLVESMRPFAQKVIDNYFKAKNQGIHCGILMAINPSNYSFFQEICEWLYNDMQVKDFKANVVCSVGKGIDLIPMTAEEIFIAQKTMIDYMLKTEAKQLIESNLAWEMIDFVECHIEKMKIPDSLCHSKICSAGREVIGITPEGNITPCGRFAWNEKEYFLGNFCQNDVASQKRFSEQLTCFMSIAPENWLRCDSCEARAICSYGCRAFIARSKARVNIECIPTQMKFHYFKSLQSAVVSVYPQLKHWQNHILSLRHMEKEAFCKLNVESQNKLRNILSCIDIVEEELINNSRIISKEEAIQVFKCLQNYLLNSD